MNATATVSSPPARARVPTFSRVSGSDGDLDGHARLNRILRGRVLVDHDTFFTVAAHLLAPNLGFEALFFERSERLGLGHALDVRREHQPGLGGRLRLHPRRRAPPDRD